MKAKFAGKCARTGQSYRAGTEITKGASGWEIAGRAASNTSRTPDYRQVRTPDGAVTTRDVSLPAFCGECVQAAGIDKAKVKSLDEVAAFAMPRQGSDFVCPRCTRILHILSDDEKWQEVILPALHMEHAGQGYYTLSHKVCDDKWALVGQYFSFLRADDLDEMDVFDMPSGWYAFAGSIPAIEEALGILPENRQEALAAKAAAEQQARAARQAQFRAGMALFPRGEGEYVQGEPDGNLNNGRTPVRLGGSRVDVGQGQDIYGGGEWFVAEGEHIWHVRNNGMDGDDWSRNNIATGGAGAVGLRFAATPDRLAFLDWLKKKAHTE